MLSIDADEISISSELDLILHCFVFAYLTLYKPQPLRRHSRALVPEAEASNNVDINRYQIMEAQMTVFLVEEYE